VYVALGNLGLLATIDYDSGELLQSSYVGIGARHLAVDRARRRIYVSNFLRGDVRAIDIDTGRTVDEWFTGRFVRFVSLSRNGRWLYAPSTMGIVRVALD
jgi:DNA-binding beta-propeller fold protein YncE